MYVSDEFSTSEWLKNKQTVDGLKAFLTQSCQEERSEKF